MADDSCTFLDHTGMLLGLLVVLLVLPFGRFTLEDKPFLDSWIIHFSIVCGVIILFCVGFAKSASFVSVFAGKARHSLITFSATFFPIASFPPLRI
ncbi:hypothetical protein EKK58_11615 [Candidatus Dependentiae bacterium]|nr:MAG: hypothetical protein EKK58_11615 [Candidatus Dependentiae bacterium]